MKLKPKHIPLYLLTCNAPALGQLNCLPLLYYQQQRERDDETRAQHSKMDLYANAIPCSETEEFDVPRQWCPRNSKNKQQQRDKTERIKRNARQGNEFVYF